MLVALEVSGAAVLGTLWAASCWAFTLGITRADPAGERALHTKDWVP